MPAPFVIIRRKENQHFCGLGFVYRTTKNVKYPFMKNTTKYALITGATSGIGFELAKLFAKNNYNLVIVARHQADLDTAAAEFKKSGVDVLTIAKDLFMPDAAQNLYNEVIANGIDIDVLVNNAGHGLYGEFLQTDMKMEINIIHLNIISLVVLTKLFLKDMVVRGSGKILNTSSIASKSPGPWQSVYHGTKAFVQSFTEAIRFEVKDKGVSVTALLPGVTDTDFFNKAQMLDSKMVQDKSEMADPADVAKDGFEALMAGKDMVVSGFKNKMQVLMNNITSDEKNATNLAEMQKPVQHH
jgi:short-subunit dehydrogenase